LFQTFDPRQHKLAHRDRYTILQPIQRGSTATVFQAIDSTTGEVVALKKYNELLPANTYQQLEQEFRIQQELVEHPHIGKARDYSASERSTAFDYYGGGDLIDYIQPNIGMDMASVIAYGKQLADALAYMHALGIVHRDLKSDNVTLDGRGNCYIIDFGMAQHVYEPPNMGRRTGTIPYISPECLSVRESPHHGMLDLKAADVWALGIILFSASTGRFLWRQASCGASAEFARYMAGCPSEEEQRLWARIPHPLRSLISNMLCVDPVQRPTAQDVYACLVFLGNAPAG
jgi:serine/threonine protein kinase